MKEEVGGEGGRVKMKKKRNLKMKEGKRGVKEQRDEG